MIKLKKIAKELDAASDHLAKAANLIESDPVITSFLNGMSQMLETVAGDYLDKLEGESDGEV